MNHEQDKQDEPESKYRDEAAELDKGSSYVEGRSSGETDGDGTESSSPKFTPAKGEQRWQQPGPGQRAAVDSAEPGDRSDASDLPSP